ncbi:hypothetical protein GOP47_0029755 [Adiantum capillus-veneris]|nr:hypothetical protein GOP47_0029755 [Adiantum capillus-veneris]
MEEQLGHGAAVGEYGVDAGVCDASPAIPEHMIWSELHREATGCQLLAAGRQRFEVRVHDGVAAMALLQTLEADMGDQSRASRVRAFNHCGSWKDM